MAISAAEDSPSGSSSESDSSSDSADSQPDSSKSDDDGDSPKKDEGGDSPTKDDAGDNDADNDAGSPSGEAEPDGEKAETEPADKSETPAENTTAPKVAETTPDVTQTEVTTPARRTPSVFPRPHKTYTVPGLSDPDHGHDSDGPRKLRKVAGPVDVAAPVIPAAPLVTPVLADRDDVKSETAYITALPVKVKEGKDGILSAFTSATGKGGLILLNQSAVVLGVLNRRSRGDGSDYLGILGPGERMTLPTQVVATGSLGKHTWDDEADGVELDEPVVQSFLEKSVVPYSVEATLATTTASDAAAEDEVYDPFAEWLSPFPGYVDLPLPGQPGYQVDPRGVEVYTGGALASNPDGIFDFGYSVESWEAAAAGDSSNVYFTLDDMPRWHYEGSSSVNSEWISALEAVAFVGFFDPGLTREPGYAAGFYDPDYNDPNESVYYTNMTGDPVLATIYRSQAGGAKTLEQIELDAGDTLEIEKPLPMTNKFVTVQAPRGPDGRVNIITTQALGYPELTQDLRTIDVPGNPPSGNPQYDNLVLHFATSHVDYYSFDPGTGTPDTWEFVATPPPPTNPPVIDPTEPEVAYKIAQIEQVLSNVLNSQAYSFLGNTMNLVGTILGNDVFTNGALAADITRIGLQLQIGEYRQAAIGIASVIVDAVGEVAKGPAKVNAVVTLVVAAAQVVLYTADKAAEIDWSSSGETWQFLRENPGVGFEELGRAVLTVGNELGLKLADGFLRAKG
ncbi:hypothetical protein [Gordonia sp. ABSL49_1]|uniref:hypothetical protein n=1 Tax=Gordonia sp. ABSL49_1 TaxID=2920941 RepID=UPI001F101B17|nr:hypothetical protein [Gordonia sp. ABSL49_1]MCH5643977.1 hypothetical protein [Gordonia sp. ABSL49_1]